MRFSIVCGVCIGTFIICDGLLHECWAELSAEELSRYSGRVRRIEQVRARLAEKLQLASEPDRDRVLADAAVYLNTALVDSLIPFWYSTPWDFYGTTPAPGQGEIACGYFVSTLLQHAGVRVERYRLAQQPSERIVRSLAASDQIHRYRYLSLEQFCSKVKELGEGLYVVGLDCHVGFLLVKHGELFFIHSNYLPPTCVVIEVGVESAALANSLYRIVGRITSNELVDKWLQGEKITTVKK